MLYTRFTMATNVYISYLGYSTSKFSNAFVQALNFNVM